MAIEKEIKFTVKKSGILEKIHEMGKICGFVFSDIKEEPHEDVYFDTPDYLLYKEKMVLRLRKNSTGKKLAFKAQSVESFTGGIHRRIEIETEVRYKPSDICKGKADSESPLRGLFGRTGLVVLMEVLKVKNKRKIMDVFRGNKKICEIVSDDVRFSGPGGKRKTMELEIELADGTENDITKIADVISEKFRLEPAPPSKYLLGMELVGGIPRDI